MVGADHGAVDHLDRLWCRPTIGQGLQQKIPQSSSAPSKELAIDGVPFAELFGQIAPGSSGARDPEYTVKCAPMIARRAAAQGACGNDKWLEKRPIHITHQSANQSCLSPRGSLESYRRFPEKSLCKQDRDHASQPQRTKNRTSTLPWEGGCQCGAVRYVLHTLPLTLYACHCKECQLQSSSAFGLSMRVPAASVEMNGHTKITGRADPSSPPVAGVFCPKCGTRLMHRSEGRDTVNIKAGTLDNTHWIVPSDISGLDPRRLALHRLRVRSFMRRNRKPLTHSLPHGQ
jgi:hypothetical protein